MLVFSPDPAPTEIYTLSLHDALPICAAPDRFVKSGSTGLGKQIFNVLTTTDHKMIGILYMSLAFAFFAFGGLLALGIRAELWEPGLQVVVSKDQYNQLLDRKSTRLNS